MIEPDQPHLRELLYEAYPRWIVDWLLAPFEDESGVFAVLAKNAVIGFTFGVVLVEVGSLALLVGAIEMVGLTIVILVLSSGLIRAVWGNGDWQV